MKDVQKYKCRPVQIEPISKSRLIILTAGVKFVASVSQSFIGGGFWMVLVDLRGLLKNSQKKKPAFWDSCMCKFEANLPEAVLVVPKLIS